MISVQLFKACSLTLHALKSATLIQLGITEHLTVHLLFILHTKKTSQKLETFFAFLSIKLDLAKQILVVVTLKHFDYI